MRLVESITAPTLSAHGLDLSATEGETALRRQLHEYGETIVSPIAARLDKLTAEEVVAPESEWWTLFASALDLGLDIEKIYLSDKASGNRLKAIIYEELGRADAGFAIGLMVAFFPVVMCHLVGRSDLAKMIDGKIGCWIATQPQRGSDLGDIEATELLDGRKHETGQMYAEYDNNEVVLHGSSSAWVSLGPVAEVSLAYFPIRQDGKAVFEDDGTLRSIGVLVPLDLDGVSKGRPLDKMGQRSLPQGSIKFDAVRVPRDYIIATEEEYRTSLLSALCEGNQTMGAVFTGLARRAYEYATQYAHERRQGGVAIAEHQLVKFHLFESFRKLENSRSTMRQTFAYNAIAPEPHVLASVVSKVTATENAIEIAADCLRMFGGNGLTRDFPIEKLLRDARASVTEDGDNHLLSLKAGSYLSWAYQAENKISKNMRLEDSYSIT